MSEDEDLSGAAPAVPLPPALAAMLEDVDYGADDYLRLPSCGREFYSIEDAALLMDGNLIDFETSYKGERWHASTKKVFADDAAQDAAREPSKPAAAARGRRVDQGAAVTLPRSEVVRRLPELDWTQTFDWSPGARHTRALTTAEAVGLQAVESSADKDSHWGGYQLRDVARMERHGGLCFDAIAAGYGFELEEGDVLVESRHRLDHPDDGPDDMNDPITIRLDQLPLLAYPSVWLINGQQARWRSPPTAGRPTARLGSRERARARRMGRGGSYCDLQLTGGGYGSDPGGGCRSKERARRRDGRSHGLCRLGDQRLDTWWGTGGGNRTPSGRCADGA